MNRTPLLIGVVVSTAIVACVDFWTTPERVGSLLFVVPLILCALQPSTRLLWGTSIAACVLTLAGANWGFDRVDSPVTLVALVNRNLLVACLLTLTTFIHLWMKKGGRLALDAAEIKQKSGRLAAQYEQLAQAEEACRTAEDALLESEERCRLLLDAVPKASVVTLRATSLPLR